MILFPKPKSTFRFSFKMGKQTNANVLFKTKTMLSFQNEKQTNQMLFLFYNEIKEMLFSNFNKMRFSLSKMKCRDQQN